MKTIKVFYSSYNRDILKEVEDFKEVAFIEAFSINDRKQMKKVKQFMEDYGTKTLPLVVIEDENLQGVAAVWSEQKPDWKKRISEILETI